MKNKSLISLDIKSLYTSIPVEKRIERLEISLRKTNIILTRIVSKLIKICTLCTSHYFQHNDTFYKQKSGLLMSSPLCAVLACIYLDFLESGPFTYLILSNSNYFRFIDEILLIYTQELNIKRVTDNIKPPIKFTYELESTNTLGFLDVLLIRNCDKLEFKVYRKPTSKNDLKHSYSHHKTNSKRAIIIDFYLRTLRICSPKILIEFCYIKII